MCVAVNLADPEATLNKYFKAFAFICIYPTFLSLFVFHHCLLGSHPTENKVPRGNLRLREGLLQTFLFRQFLL